jgi:hypothetical protein
MALVRRYAPDEEQFFRTMIFPEEDRGLYTRALVKGLPLVSSGEHRVH